MAKADLVLPGGAKVSVEGTPEEVRQVIESLSSMTSVTRRKRARRSISVRMDKKGGTGATTRVRTLKEQGFFSQKRSLGDIVMRLKELGHVYRPQDLSSVLVRMTRDKELRRFQEGGVWHYVNP